MENEIVIDITPAKIRKAAPMLALIAIGLISAGVLGSYILHFLYETPASITVSSNFYEVKLYDSDTLTTEITSILFPTVMYQDLDTTDSTTPTYYLNAVSVQTGKPVTCTWTSTVGDLYPDDLTLTAEYFDGTNWLTWIHETGIITLTDTDPTIMVRWTIDAASAYVNGYSFDIDIQALSES